jgi:hypothetical protein
MLDCLQQLMQRETQTQNGSCTVKNHSPTADANRADILGRRRTGTLFCVVFLQDAKPSALVVVGHTRGVEVEQPVQGGRTAPGLLPR